ncbi:hypothetical protein H8D36_01230 [archaeon]|nr:hypothetical protein [archaeon]MBL7057309.1 hypothetical protein [Candidatus Woesearchaeota archaeon]
MNNIVSLNLKLMNSGSEGGMRYLMLEESFGGPGRFGEGYTSAGLEYRFDPKTGEIKEFDSYNRYMQGEFRDFPRHILEVAILNNLSGMGIIDYKAPRICSLEARQNLEESVRVYNLNQNFNLGRSTFRKAMDFSLEYLRNQDSGLVLRL